MRAQPDQRRRIPVRLTDIPLDRRLRAADHACLLEHDPVERLRIHLAAVQPSRRVYWIAP